MFTRIALGVGTAHIQKMFVVPSRVIKIWIKLNLDWQRLEYSPPKHVKGEQRMMGKEKSPSFAFLLPTRPCAPLVGGSQ